MKKYRKTAYNLISVFIAVILICFPVSEAYEVNAQTPESQALIKSDQINNALLSGDLTEDIKKLIDYDETRKVSYDGLGDLNSITLINADESKSLYVFETQVKYMDENGVVQYKSNEIIPSSKSRSLFSK